MTDRVDSAVGLLQASACLDALGYREEYASSRSQANGSGFHHGRDQHMA